MTEDELREVYVLEGVPGMAKAYRNLKAERDTLREMCELTLLFYSGGAWDGMKVARWSALTDKHECTTRVLCDTIRKALGEEADA